MSAALEGELSFARVPHWLAQADALAKSQALDLSRVSRADSAGLALLLELSRKARKQGHTLAFRGAPTQLIQLATFFGLDGVLRFES